MNPDPKNAKLTTRTSFPQADSCIQTLNCRDQAHFACKLSHQPIEISTVELILPGARPSPETYASIARLAMFEAE